MIVRPDARIEQHAKIKIKSQQSTKKRNIIQSRK